MGNFGVFRRSSRIGLGLATAALTTLAIATAGPAGARPAEPGGGAAILGAGSANAIPGSYIIVLKDGVASAAGATATAGSLRTRYGGTITHVYSATITGYAAEMSEAAARKVTADPRVAYVAQNTRELFRSLRRRPTTRCSVQRHFFSSYVAPRPAAEHNTA